MLFTDEYFNIRPRMRIKVNGKSQLWLHFDLHECSVPDPSVTVAQPLSNGGRISNGDNWASLRLGSPLRTLSDCNCRGDVKSRKQLLLGLSCQRCWGAAGVVLIQQQQLLRENMKAGERAIHRCSALYASQTACICFCRCFSKQCCVFSSVSRHNAPHQSPNHALEVLRDGAALRQGRQPPRSTLLLFIYFHLVLFSCMWCLFKKEGLIQGFWVSHEN